MISERTIEAIKDRVSLLEVVGELVQLKRQGTNHMGLCPFHGEKSPSFSVREDAKFYHCFGCGASGNVITFVMQTRGLSFVDAVEDLAQRAGIPVEHIGGAKTPAARRDIRPTLLRVNAMAQEYFLRSLQRAAPVVTEYVQSRRLSKESMQTFGVGFAPLERRGLLEYLKGKGCSEELVITAGLARRSQQGEVIDTFRGRLMFPIWVDRKRIAAFGGRMIPALFENREDYKIPKYINSPETPLYQKNRVFFGGPQAIDDIRREKHVYMVEGYLDVIAMHQAGVRNVLAACGTALTPRHVKRLSHLAHRVTVLFDGDQAGMNAAGRAFELFLNSGIDSDAIFLPSGHDPDSYAAAQTEGLARSLAELPRISLFDCYLRRLLDQEGVPSGAAAKGRLATMVREVLLKVSNPVEQHAYIEKAALRLGIPVTELESLVRQGKPLKEQPLAAPARQPAAEAMAYPAIQDLPRIDQELLRATMGLKGTNAESALRDPLICAEVQPATLAFLQGVSEVRKVGGAEQGAAEGERKEALKELLRSFGPSWRELWKEAHEMREDDSVNFARSYDECRSSIQRLRTKKRIVALQTELSNATDDGKRMALAQELQQLEQQLRQTRPQG
ncbi:MAG: DNA primase [Bdellovibrionota bacterium]|nr:MAG: DNA primase [Bdellovibrionota bacterium]